MPHNINALTNCFFIFFRNQISVMINYPTNLTKKVFYKTSPYIFSHNIIALTNFFFFFTNKLSWWLIIKPTWTRNVSYRTSQYLLSQNSNALTNCLFFVNQVAMMISYQTDLTKKILQNLESILSHNINALTNFFVFFSNKLPWRLIIRPTRT